MAKTIGSRAVSTGRGGADVASGTSDAMVSQREDLSNFISMITRDETPFLASIGKTKATNKNTITKANFNSILNPFFVCYFSL